MSQPDEIKVLVVEDDADLQEVYVMILRSQGYEVEAADNGLEALNKLRRFTPDVILLDYLMPKMDGKNFLENFEKESMPGVRIIVCSNIADMSALEEMVRLGADRTILKSDLSPIDLINLVETTMETQR